MASATRPSRTKSELDKQEFERLYRESYELVYNYVSYRMACSTDADAITAEAFLKAARLEWVG